MKWYEGVQLALWIIVILTIIIGGIIIYNLNKISKDVTSQMQETDKALQKINNTLNTLSSLPITLSSIDLKLKELDSVKSQSAETNILVKEIQTNIITLNEEFSNLSIWINNIDQNIILASKINQEQVNEAVSNAINVRISYYIIAITISSIFGALFGSLLTYVKIKKS